MAGGSMISPLAMLTKDAKLETGKPFKMNYAFHDGMFKNSAGADFLDQIQYGHDIGFRAIEDNGMMSRTPAEQEKIGNLLTRLNMSMGVFVLGFDKWPPTTTLTSGNLEWRNKFLKAAKEAIDVSKRCSGKLVTVVPGNFDRTIPLGYQAANVMESFRLAADLLHPNQIVMVMEPLSDNPDLFLRHSADAYAMCKAVNNPACKILFDIYHMQRNEGDLIKGIDRGYEEIAYYQIGDNPGRYEPGTGEVNYKNIFKHLYNKGYRGMLGMEHGNFIPGKEGEAALVAAYREADNF